MPSVFGVPTLHRHVFLDNHLTEAYISKQFQQLINIAKVNKIAVGIAHPHPESIAVLKKLIPTLAENNIELVAISTLVNQTAAAIKTAQVTE